MIFFLKLNKSYKIINIKMEMPLFLINNQQPRVFSFHWKRKRMKLKLWSHTTLEIFMFKNIHVNDKITNLKSHYFYKTIIIFEI